ncbi:twin-arginine translocation signal domain-containing protein [Rhizobium leguminosarum]|uniref:twin-arginine translocation signal domain-containing protein n=1 Tax=Rhizobium leguminosarum TaxID=384 RepID=UPI003F9E92D3
MLRRDFLRQSALIGAALSTGCTSDDATPIAPGKGQPLIDAHCHLFNASDLPTTRFLRQVVFENYPEQSFRVMGVWNPDATDVAIELALRLLGTNTAPDADQEIRVLTNKAHPERTAANREQARQLPSRIWQDFSSRLTGTAATGVLRPWEPLGSMMPPHRKAEKRSFWTSSSEASLGQHARAQLLP